jgi:putative endonuclease
LVERLVWDQEVAGSNPVTPIFFRRENMFHVYVLRSGKTGRRYIGSCEDVAARLRRHNNKESKATRHGIPWILIHTQGFETRSDAMKKERYYKTGRGRDELDRL